MKIKITPILFCFFVCFCSTFLCAQKAKLQVQINADHLQAKDTFDISATYTLGDKKLPPCTLAMVLKENNGPAIWQLRWPMIDGKAEASIVMPAGLSAGKYTCYFAVQPRFFRLFGQVLYPPNVKKLTTHLILPTRINQYEVPVENGKFEIKNFLFYNTIVLEIEPPKSKYMPAIHLESWLDSAFEPAAFNSKEMAIGVFDSTTSLKSNIIKNWDECKIFFDPFYQTKKLGNLSNSKKFDSIYVSQSFKKNIIKQFDCLGDSELIKSKDVEKFLRKYFAGFKFSDDLTEFQTLRAQNEHYEFVFYLNETTAKVSRIANLLLSDIAAINILNTNTKTINGKDEAIVSIYTKQGPFATKNFTRYNYIVNGYQPEVYLLPTSSKMFASSPYYVY